MQITNCEQKIDDINTLISHLLDDKEAIFFSKVNVIRPNFQNKELSFVRLVTWLYTLYFEAGKDSLKVIKTSMSPESRKLYTNNSKLVNNFRTKLHHNLDRTSSRSFKIEKDCHKWTKSVCSKQIPTSEAEWEQCSVQLLQEAYEVLTTIASELEQMTDSKSQKEIFIYNWLASKEKSLQPHIYDQIIETSLALINQKDIDVVSYRKKYYENWNNSISLLNSDANYDNEARKIVESSIIKDFSIRLPVTMSTLDEHFILSSEFICSLLQVLHLLDFSNSSEMDIIEKLKEKLPTHALD